MTYIIGIIFFAAIALTYYTAAKRFKTSEDSREDKWAYYEHRKKHKQIDSEWED